MARQYERLLFHTSRSALTSSALVSRLTSKTDVGERGVDQRHTHRQTCPYIHPQAPMHTSYPIHCL